MLSRKCPYVELEDRCALLGCILGLCLIAQNFDQVSKSCRVVLLSEHASVLGYVFGLDMPAQGDELEYLTEGIAFARALLCRFRDRGMKITGEVLPPLRNCAARVSRVELFSRMDEQWRGRPSSWPRFCPACVLKAFEDMGEIRAFGRHRPYPFRCILEAFRMGLGGDSTGKISC